MEVIELSFYSPAKDRKWTFSIGYGGLYYGQSYFITFVSTDLERGQVVFGRLIWKCGPTKEHK
jgi:hypothetical protein